MLGYQLVRDQGEGAPLEHVAAEIAHDGGSLEVQVAEHFVGAPTA